MKKGILITLGLFSILVFALIMLLPLKTDIPDEYYEKIIFIAEDNKEVHMPITLAVTNQGESFFSDFNRDDNLEIEFKAIPKEATIEKDPFGNRIFKATLFSTRESPGGKTYNHAYFVDSKGSWWGHPDLEIRFSSQDSLDERTWQFLKKYCEEQTPMLIKAKVKIVGHTFVKHSHWFYGPHLHDHAFILDVSIIQLIVKD